MAPSHPFSFSDLFRVFRAGFVHVTPRVRLTFLGPGPFFLARRASGLPVVSSRLRGRLHVALLRALERRDPGLLQAAGQGGAAHGPPPLRASASFWGGRASLGVRERCGNELEAGKGLLATCGKRTDPFVKGSKGFLFEGVAHFVTTGGKKTPLFGRTRGKS